MGKIQNDGSNDGKDAQYIPCVCGGACRYHHTQVVHFQDGTWLIEDWFECDNCGELIGREDV